MNYPVTYERYHVYNSSATLPTICDTLQLAIQLVSSFPVGTIAHVERVVERHEVYQVFGTALMPLPSPPTTPIPTQTNQITHIKKG